MAEAGSLRCLHTPRTVSGFSTGRDSALFNLASSHHPFSVLGAVAICAVTAWLVLALLDQAQVRRGRRRLGWMAATAVVGGLGVWATHFAAMLGYRPDFRFSYDADTTVASAVMAIILVGVPFAAVALTDRRLIQAACGSVAGGGVAAMHFVGMQALQGCVVTHPLGTIGLATASGIALLALAFSLPDRRHRRVPIAVLIVAAVCAVHFTAMAGLVLDMAEASEIAAVDHTTLRTIVAAVVLWLLLTAASCAVSSAKIEVRRRQEILLTAALNNMSNGLLLVGAGGRITLLNDRLLKLFQIDGSQVAVGMSWQDYLRNLGAHLGWTAARLERVLENHAMWFAKDTTTYLEHALDDGRIISISCRPMENGGAVLTYDDITVERKAQKSLERLAFVDPLTDLANRRAFQNELRLALEGGEELALLFIDLDRFKAINDTLGHAVGDQLLIDVGSRLRAACTPDDLVARLGGDEMALLTRKTTEASVSQLADAIVADIAEPFPILGHTIIIGCTIGVATTAHTRDAETLIQYADLALFRAKSKGRGQSHRYESGMQEAVRARRRLEADLRVALAREQFSLVYQPICRISDRRIIGFEALIRWHHPEYGALSPDCFIPVAEDTGLIQGIGQWALHEACCQTAHWPTDVHVAVNVSPMQLRNSAFAISVARTLQDCGLEPSRLEIELTETALVEDGLQIAASLQALRDLGVRVAMDDFGTGYSSFAHLVDFDLDRIKIDQTFVQAAPGKGSALAVVRAVIQMARDLGVSTIGEGVETTEQLDLLQRLGCDAAQGYLLGAPLSAEHALQSLRAQNPGAVISGCLQTRG